MTLCLTFTQATKPTETGFSLTRTDSLRSETSRVAKLSYAEAVTLPKAPASAGEQAAAVSEALAFAAAEAAPVKPLATGCSAEEEEVLVQFSAPVCTYTCCLPQYTHLHVHIDAHRGHPLPPVELH